MRQSTGTSDLREAERFLAHLIEQHRNAQVYGVRPKRLFRDAAVRYLREETKASIKREAELLKILKPFIGDLYLESVHMGTLQAYIQDRREAKWEKRTINYGLQVVRHILNLAASEWMDEHGLTWLAHAPKIKLLREDDKKDPCPLSPQEQVKLFAELPKHLSKMALFKVNTGCREAEVCSLRWDWEIDVPVLNTSVFVIPARRVNNRQDRLVVLNRVAEGVIEEMRGKHPEFVFTYRCRPVQKMYSAAWRNARERAGVPDVRVHDLKHTFGRRLRAAGVSLEDRQDLLGHKSGRITTHYSQPELENLISASNKACSQEGGHTMDTLVILRKKKAVCETANCR
ncbi:MAG: site-specific integrase [Desulfomonile tiedjei]|uniref:Site-specific integrase n=1 Tax=Desulfomonile tiedjei TaxID=2358 RepID=A0A9D6Z6E7_9BACT|nr:site-specific integrase [Desulfomonile tiedjei]